MKRILALLAVLLAVPASADSNARHTDRGGIWRVYTLCSAQAGTGDCTSGGDEIVLDTAELASVAFVSVGSTGTYSCDIVGNNTGHDAASGAGQTLNSTSLSGSQLAITLTDTPRFVWITCTANSGAVTVTAFGRLNR